jgi:spore germination protein GerM
MQEQQSARRIPLGVVAGISAAVLAAGGSTAWWLLSSAPSVPIAPTSQAPTSTQKLPSPVADANTETVQIYWLKDTGKNIQLVPSPIKLEKTNKPNTLLEGAFKQLLAGSKDKTLSSTIPAGTKIRSIEVRDNDVYVDLSTEFTSGGGSASMSSRLGQILYTATTLNPSAKVWVKVEGKKLDVLGGEGIVLDQPMTRKNFEDNFKL